MDEVFYRLWLKALKAFNARPHKYANLETDEAKANGKNNFAVFCSGFIGSSLFLLQITYFFAVLPLVYEQAIGQSGWFSSHESAIIAFLVSASLELALGLFVYGKLYGDLNLEIRMCRARVTLENLKGTEGWRSVEPWRELLALVTDRLGELKEQRRSFMKTSFSFAVTLFITVILGRMLQSLPDQAPNAATMIVNLIALCTIAAVVTPAAAFCVWSAWLWSKGFTISRLEAFKECLEFRVADMRAADASHSHAPTNPHNPAFPEG